MVYWLVMCISGTCGVSVIPIPYDSYESCIYASKSVYKGECVPQEITDLQKAWESQNNYYGRANKLYSTLDDKK